MKKIWMLVLGIVVLGSLSIQGVVAEEVILVEEKNTEEKNTEEKNTEEKNAESKNAEEKTAEDKARVQELKANISTMGIDISYKDELISHIMEGILFDSITYIPLRSFIEYFQLGEISWENDTRTVHVKKGAVSYAFPVGSSLLTIDDVVYDMGNPSLLYEGHIYIPLRFFSEKLGCKVDFDGEYYIVNLSFEEGIAITPNPEALTVNYSKVITKMSVKDLQDFAKLVMREAGYIDYEGRVGVACVVMNRVKTKEYPNTVHSVIYDKEYAIQFTPVWKKNFPSTKPNKDSVRAMKVAVRGWNNIEDCLYFNHVPFRSRKVVKEIDGMYFMR